MHFSNLQLFTVCVLIWGSTWLAITFQLGTVAPELSVAYRFLLAAGGLFVFCRWQGHRLEFQWHQHLDLLMFGATMFCLSYIFVYHAEVYIVSGMVAVAYSASPMINMLASRLFFGTPLTVRVSVAASLGMVGIVCVFWNEFSKLTVGHDAQLGIVFTILSVLASSAGSMVAMRTQRRGFDTWPSMAWGMFYGGALALIYAVLIGREFLFEATFAYVGTLVYLAVFGSIITFACYLTLLRRLGAAPSSYVGVMVPVVALGISFFFEKFQWGWMTSLGVVLSVAGNILMLGAAFPPPEVSPNSVHAD